MNSNCLSRFVCFNRWLALLAAFALSLSPAAYAESPDEEYLQIFDLIGQADSLSEKGEADRAKAKYVEARKKLSDFRESNPTWNPNLITHRLKYVSGKLGAQMPKVSAPATAAPASSEAKSPAVTASRSEVKLISNGAEPRVELRLRPKAGDKQSATMEMTMSMAMDMGEGAEMPAMKMPSMKITMETEVTGVSSDGDISYATEMSGAAADEPGGDPQAGAALAAGLDSVKGLKVAGKMSARGESKSVDYKLPPGASSQAKGSLDQMQNFMGQTTFPEAPVGVGAKWETERSLKSQGMNITQKEAYELTSVAGDVVTLKTSVTQRAANQKVSNPMMPNLKLDLKKLQSTGGGTAVIDLRKVLPVSSEMEMQNEVVMSMNMGGQKQDMSTKMGMKLKLESK
jgi:hypothetical protein